MCVDLLLRHSPDEFDYEVLAAQFQRFGPLAAAKLLSLAEKNRKKATPRAQDILGQKGWRFDPAQQKQIADLWPSNHPEKHALIMASIGSPMMRNKAIETLVHPDENTRLASRYVLRNLPPEMDFPLPPQAVGILTRAANQYPSYELVDLAAKLDVQTAQPLLRALLQSGDMHTIGAAWDELKRQGMTADQQDKFLALMWAKFKDPTNMNRMGFFALTRYIPGELSTEILRSGLTDQRDWSVVFVAAHALGERGDIQSKPTLTGIAASHPILDVKAAATAALKALETGKLDQAEAYEALKKAQIYCDVQGHDFMDGARQMPFFDKGQIRTETGALIPARRYALTSAVPTKSGWLAGYWISPSGGLLYYDNQSGDYKRLSDQSVIAIIPTEKLPLGQFANRFWVIMDDVFLTRIMHLDMTEDQPQLTPHAALPTIPNAIAILPDQSLQFDFSESRKGVMLFPPHPPLKLLPNGGIVQGCTDVKAVDPTPQVLPR